jgi:hypothetical protein
MAKVWTPLKQYEQEHVSEGKNERSFPLHDYVAHDGSPADDEEVLEDTFDTLGLGFSNLGLRCVDIFAEYVVFQDNVQTCMAHLFTDAWLHVPEGENLSAKTAGELLETLGGVLSIFIERVQSPAMHWRLLKTLLHMIIGMYWSRFVQECFSANRKGSNNLKIKNFPLFVTKMSKEIELFKEFAQEFADLTSDFSFQNYMTNLFEMFRLFSDICAVDDEEYLGVYIPKILDAVNRFNNSPLACSAAFHSMIDMDPPHVLHAMLRFRGDGEQARSRLLVFFCKAAGLVESRKYTNAAVSLRRHSANIRKSITQKNAPGDIKNNGMFHRVLNDRSMAKAIVEEDEEIRGIAKMYVYIERGKLLYELFNASQLNNVKSLNLYCKLKLLDKSTGDMVILERQKTNTVRGAAQNTVEWKNKLIFTGPAVRRWDQMRVEVWNKHHFLANDAIGIGVVLRSQYDSERALMASGKYTTRDVKINVELERIDSRSQSARTQQTTAITSNRTQTGDALLTDAAGRVEASKPCVELSIYTSIK